VAGFIPARKGSNADLFAMPAVALPSFPTLTRLSLPKAEFKTFPISHLLLYRIPTSHFNLSDFRIPTSEFKYLSPHCSALSP